MDGQRNDELSGVSIRSGQDRSIDVGLKEFEMPWLMLLVDRNRCCV
jgi:hypothetical protein